MTMLSKVEISFSLTTVIFVVISAYAAFNIYRRYKKPRTYLAVEAFKLNVHLVVKSEECEPLIYELRRRSMGHNAIGFDCEWVTEGKKRRPVSLLQLSTFDGYCVLIRLNLLDEPFPPSLLALLEDTCIYKVGLAPLNDANYLFQDYSIKTASTVDLRHFVEMCGHSVGGLAHLTESLLGVVLDKYWKVRCSNWDADTLTPRQLHYAASDAYAAIRIFVKLVNNLDKPSYKVSCGLDSDESLWENIDDVCAQYVDINYKQANPQKPRVRNDKEKKAKEPKLGKRYPHLKRSKPLYDNCYLQAPDGEVLSTIDSKKAMWYVEKELADVIEPTPLTVRLRFEPAGRSVGEVGRYYTLVKENKCVVCGEMDSYIRKNVVPREYRKYFPEILKDHSSHDIVLLCGLCHQRSNIRDQAKREQLARLCAAPLPLANGCKCVEDRRCKKVRMAARALLNDKLGKCSLPEERKKTLLQEVLSYYTNYTEVTDTLLEEAVNLTVMIENENYNAESHGEGVVRYFLKQEAGGLMQLEQLWREHFLAAMRPRHMPRLWSLTHTLDRLRIKWMEGRLSKEQMRSIGDVECLFNEQA